MPARKRYPPADLIRPPFGPFMHAGHHNGGTTYLNERYQVIVTDCGPIIHLSIKHLLNGPLNYLQDWRDYQRIKDELCGPQREAVQIFPAADRLVDGANQFHLWVLKEGRFPFGFDTRLLSEGDLGINVTQRPFDPDNRPDDVFTGQFADHPLHPNKRK